MDIERSFAESNKTLAEGFERYMTSRGMSPKTKRAYLDTVGRFVELLGSKNVLEAKKFDIRRLQGGMIERGLHPNSIRLHTAALRSFFRFLRMAEILKASDDPMLSMASRKVPGRLPRVLTVREIERMIEASKTPFERALIEVLYSTALRVSELIAMRLEDIDFENRVMRVNKGKGGKDRIVLFGRKAAESIAEYLGARKQGFLFEHPASAGLEMFDFSWYGHFKTGRVERYVLLGRTCDLSREAAQKRFDDIASDRAEEPHRPYCQNNIRLMLRQIGRRAGVAGVHPHSFRRACATHMLEHGADIRSVQELLGHVSLVTTQIYTNLSPQHLMRIHERCHPHAKESAGEKTA